MDIQVKKISKSLPEFCKAEQLYMDAFPANERAPFRLLMRKARRKTVDFLLIYDHDIWLGFTYAIYKEDLVYLFYLAIAPQHRGKGYGSAVLQKLKELYSGKRIFLSMEEMDKHAENYEQRVKRRAFYAANGFHMIGKKVQEGDLIYDLVGTGKDITAREYKQMMNEYMGLMRFLVKMEVIEASHSQS